MRRPSAAREALRLSPLMKTGRADSSGVEGVPLIPACAEPFVLFAGRPAAERAVDTRTRRVVAFVFLFEIIVQNCRRFPIREGAHTS